DTDEYNVWKEIGYWRDLMEIKMNVDENPVSARIVKSSHGEMELSVNGKTYACELRSMEENILEMSVDGDGLEFFISRDKMGRGFVSLNGHIFTVVRYDVLPKEDYLGTHEMGGSNGGIVSPMPGKVIKINVKDGAEVKKGDILMVVEAMKMENNILSPKDGKIEKVNVKTGEMVDGSRELVVMGE
ncbi:MAG: biotin/lipoyl-binding protein, partial [Flavobacteriales bacterium]|nr:biotin/lipoyl-binding protein [Flavobacteriales bacterium]